MAIQACRPPSRQPSHNLSSPSAILSHTPTVNAHPLHRNYHTT